MRKLILEEWLSLDGFAADRDRRLDFFPATETGQFSDRDQLAFLDTVDTILLGRRTYELFVDFWPTATTDREVVADRLNTIPKLVFSNTLDEAPWGACRPAQVVRGDAVAAVRRLKAQEGRHMVPWGSLSLAQALMAADLIDEYHLQVCPTVLGGGRRLFPEREVQPQPASVGHGHEHRRDVEAEAHRAHVAQAASSVRGFRPASGPAAALGAPAIAR